VVSYIVTVNGTFVRETILLLWPVDGADVNDRRLLMSFAGCF